MKIMQLMLWVMLCSFTLSVHALFPVITGNDYQVPSEEEEEEEEEDEGDIGDVNNNGDGKAYGAIEKEEVAIEKEVDDPYRYFECRFGSGVNGAFEFKSYYLLNDFIVKTGDGLYDKYQTGKALVDALSIRVDGRKMGMDTSASAFFMWGTYIWELTFGGKKSIPYYKDSYLGKQCLYSCNFAWNEYGIQYMYPVVEIKCGQKLKLYTVIIDNYRFSQPPLFPSDADYRFFVNKKEYQNGSEFNQAGYDAAVEAVNRKYRIRNRETIPRYTESEHFEWFMDYCLSEGVGCIDEILYAGRVFSTDAYFNSLLVDCFIPDSTEEERRKYGWRRFVCKIFTSRPELNDL